MASFNVLAPIPELALNGVIFILATVHVAEQSEEESA